jgi:hypothetical protein
MGGKKHIEFNVDDNGCFNCISHAKINGGYHRIKINYKHEMVHRYVFEQCFGFIPEDLIVRHKCDNPSCINPEHLELGTPKDNMEDKSKRGRCNAPYGVRNKASKLNDLKVLEIKSLIDDGLTLKDIAERYDVSLTTIWRVKEGETWGRVKEIKAREASESLPS